jgi:predicted HNH restriction endonuclease
MGKKVADMTPAEIERQREYSREYHRRNRVLVSERKKAKRLERYATILAKFSNKCSDCGITDMPNGFFDFHHLDPNEKDRNISQMLSSASFDKVLNELDKCVMLCPNCHRLRHIGAGHYVNAKSEDK